MKGKLGDCLVWMCLGGLLAPIQPLMADDWEWTVAPYIWAQDVGLDVTIDGDPVFGGSASFNDLVDDIDMAFMGHFEGRKDRWGLYLDTIYVDLSEGNTIPVGPGGPVLGDFMTEVSVKLQIYDAGGLYRLSDPGSDVNFDLLAGLRYVDVDTGASLTFPGPEMNRFAVDFGTSETDLMVGGRLTGKFSPKWNWLLRGDLSFGGTEGTYNGLVGIGYTFGDTGLFTLDLGYRYMSIEVDSTSSRGGQVQSDLTLSGPVLGFVFNF